MLRYDTRHSFLRGGQGGSVSKVSHSTMRRPIKHRPVVGSAPVRQRWSDQSQVNGFQIKFVIIRIKHLGGLNFLCIVILYFFIETSPIRNLIRSVDIISGLPALYKLLFGS